MDLDKFTICTMILISIHSHGLILLWSAASSPVSALTRLESKWIGNLALGMRSKLYGARFEHYILSLLQRIHVPPLSSSLRLPDACHDVAFPNSFTTATSTSQLSAHVPKIMALFSYLLNSL